MKKLSDELSAEEQERLLALAESHSQRELVKLMGQARPEGFERKVTLAAVHRFLKEKKAERLRAEVEETLARAKEMRSQVGLQGGELHEGAMAVLRQRFFEEATTTLKSGEVSSMYRLLLDVEWREKRLDLLKERAEVNRRYLELARERFEFNAARSALEFADELQALVQNESLDDQTRITRAREQLFGKRVIDGVKEVRK